MINETPEPENLPLDRSSPAIELEGITYSNAGSEASVSANSKEIVDEESQKESSTGPKMVKFVEPTLVFEGSQKGSPRRKMSKETSRILARIPSGVININELNNEMAESLRPYDINGDGMISLTELVHGALTQQEQQEKVIFFRRLIIGFVIVWLLTMGAFFGVVYGAIEATKESKVDENNSNDKGGASLVTKDNSYIVQTANSDFFVGNDGAAYVRGVTSEAYAAAEGSADSENANYNVMKTSAATANVTFSSNFPDELLMELKTISIRSVTGAYLSLQVHGILRMPPEGLATVGAVTLITHIGRIVIDGTALSFYDDTEVAIFESAGFIVSGGASVGGRRLLDGVQALFGIFNAVASLKDWYNPADYQNLPPPKLPDNFIMYSRRYAPCVINPAPNDAIVEFDGTYMGGTFPSTPGIDICALLNIDDEHLASTYFSNGTLLQRFIETEYTITRLGSEYLRVEYIHPLHPNVTFVEVLDNSDPHNPQQFHYNVDTDTRGLKVTTVSADVEIVEFVGPIYYYNTSHVTEQSLIDQALSAPFDYLGVTKFQGVDVRIWAMHLHNNTVHAFWYDSVDTQEVQRIDYGDFGMLDVVGMVALNESDASSMSYLFTAPVANLTKVMSGNSDDLPPRTGVNPYEPFTVAYRESLGSGGGEMYTERKLRNGFSDEFEEEPEVVPEELLIKDAATRRRRRVPAAAAAVEVPEVREVPAVVPVVPVVQVIEATEERRVLAASPSLKPTFKPTFKPSLKPTASPTQYCPPGWVAGDNTCYYFYSASYSGNWNYCKDLCASNGASMLCIQSAAQNDFVFKEVYNRGKRRTWIGLSRNSDNVWTWNAGCESYYTVWNTAGGEPSATEKYAAMIGSYSTRWFDINEASYACACQNAFNPTARPTTRPPTYRPSMRPTGPSYKPSPRPTARPSTRIPTLTSGTHRPTSSDDDGSNPLSFPQITAPSDISAISDFVTKKFGCKADNKCDNFMLWYTTISAPYFPVLTATGNENFPCVFATTVDVPYPVPVIPVIEFSVEAGIELAFCNDMSALDYILGSVTVSVGITGVDLVPEPFDQIFSWQVATVGLGVTFFVAEMWCSIDGNGVTTYSNSEAYGLLRRIKLTPRAPQICRCMERGQTYPGMLYVIGGPDIPGAVLGMALMFAPLAFLLAFTRITNQATLENFPNVCEMSISRTTMSVDILLNLGMYIYSVNALSFAMKFSSKSGSGDFIGAYLETPKGLNMFISQGEFVVRYFTGPFTKAANQLIRIVNKGNIVWTTILKLGGALATAVTKYFQAKIYDGELVAGAAGDFGKSLYKIFEPRPVIVRGCFKPYIEKPRCTKSYRIFRRRICVRYSMPKLRCGSTSQCIKYCDSRN